MTHNILQRLTMSVFCVYLQPWMVMWLLPVEKRRLVDHSIPFVVVGVNGGSDNNMERVQDTLHWNGGQAFKIGEGGRLLTRIEREWKNGWIIEREVMEGGYIVRIGHQPKLQEKSVEIGHNLYCKKYDIYIYIYIYILRDNNYISVLLLGHFKFNSVRYLLFLCEVNINSTPF